MSRNELKTLYNKLVRFADFPMYENQGAAAGDEAEKARVSWKRFNAGAQSNLVQGGPLPPEIAERLKAIELIEAAKEAERQAIGIKVAAEAEKLAAADRAEALRLCVVGRAHAHPEAAVATAGVLWRQAPSVFGGYLPRTS